jgi:fructokinase
MTRSNSNRTTIVCFGEALWDILPRGIFLGGAPLNVAYHLSYQGLNAVPVSAVGRDFLGDEALRRIEEWKLETRFIARRDLQPTGTVRASLDRKGVATYRIMRHVAWDHIPAPRPLLQRKPPQAVVFGTLALRGRSNRHALEQIFAAWPDTWRVLDLNLRAPFDRGPAIAFALQRAQILKLNAEELARLIDLPTRTPAQLEKAARRLSQQRSLPRICVTAGEHGAGLLWDHHWYWEPGRRIELRDTIGAGDAFLAAFLAAILVRRRPPALALAAACRMGEFVAGCDGATPPYNVKPRAPVTG